jgi:hypothetical protein
VTVPKPCHDRHRTTVEGCVWCCRAEHDAEYRRRCGIEGPASPGECPRAWEGGSPSPAPAGLGDEVEALVKSVGADKLAKLYEQVTGRSCGCKGRKALLNKLPAVLPQIKRLLGG